MHAQWIQENTFMEETHEAINDHSDCLKLLKSHIMGIRSDLEKLAQDVANHDRQLQDILKTFGTTVTTQGADTETLRNEAMTSLKDVAEYLESLRLGGSSAASGQSTDTASLEHKMLALQTRTDESLKRLESLVHDTREELRAGAQKGTPA